MVVEKFLNGLNDDAAWYIKSEIYDNVSDYKKFLDFVFNFTNLIKAKYEYSLSSDNVQDKIREGKYYDKTLNVGIEFEYNLSPKNKDGAAGKRKIDKSVVCKLFKKKNKDDSKISYVGFFKLNYKELLMLWRRAVYLMGTIEFQDLYVTDDTNISNFNVSEGESRNSAAGSNMVVSPTNESKDIFSELNTYSKKVLNEIVSKNNENEYYDNLVLNYFSKIKELNDFYKNDEDKLPLIFYPDYIALDINSVPAIEKNNFEENSIDFYPNEISAAVLVERILKNELSKNYEKINVLSLKNRFNKFFKYTEFLILPKIIQNIGFKKLTKNLSDNLPNYLNEINSEKIITDYLKINKKIILHYEDFFDKLFTELKIIDYSDNIEKFLNNEFKNIFEDNISSIISEKLKPKGYNPIPFFISVLREIDILMGNTENLTS